MKQLLITVFLFIFAASLAAQDFPCPPEEGCQCLMNKADAILEGTNPDYEQALYLYFAAQACDEALTNEAEERIVELFERVANLRLTAENRALMIQQQQEQLIREKEIAEEATRIALFHQEQLLVEKEIAELATRKAIAQNLNNLAIRAISGGNMIEAFLLMQYANAYDPDNIQWLDNLQELFVRNAPGYPADDYLNLLPTHVNYPLNSIVGLIFLENNFISWGLDGSLAAWDKEGNVLWEKTYKTPIAGLRILTDSTGFISWNEKGIIRIHGTNGDIRLEFNHGSKPTSVYLLNEGAGYLSWSSDNLKIWNENGQQQNEIGEKAIFNVFKRKNNNGYLCIFEHKEMQGISASGEIEKSWELPGFLPTTFFDLNDSLVMMHTVMGHVVTWNLKTDEQSIYAIRGGIDGLAPVETGQGYLAWNDYEIWNDNFEAPINGNITGIQSLKDSSGFLVRFIDGALERFDWDGNSIFKYPNDATLIKVEVINDNGQLLYNCENGSIYIRNYNTGEFIAKMKPSQPILDFHFDEEQNMVMAWSADGSVFYWDPFTVKSPRIVHRSGSYLNNGLTPMPDHSGLLKPTQYGFNILNWNGKVMQSIKPRENGTTEIIEHNQFIYAFRFTKIYRYDLTGRLINAFDPGFNTMHTEFLVNDSTIIAYNSTGSIHTWDLNGNALHNFSIGGSLNEMSLVPGTNNILSKNRDVGITIWTLTGDRISGPFPNSTSLNDLFISDNGNFILGRLHEKIFVWNSQGELFLEKDLNYVYPAIKIHPNHQGFLFSDEVGNLSFCDWEGTTTLLLQLDSRIINIDFMEDQTSYITMTESGGVACWDELGNPISQLKFNAPVSRLEYIQDCSAYISLASREEYLIWSLNPSDILKDGNSLGIRDFTDAEKRKYGIDLDVIPDWEYLPYPWLRE